MEAVKASYTRGIGQALVAALLFGVSTPFAKWLLGSVAPGMLAGLLYAGSGAGLLLWMMWRRRKSAVSLEAPLSRGDLRWLIGAVVFGGVLGPLLLMLGLARTPASTASLLLNMESVLTALLAWVVFRENVDRRILLGMLAIVAGVALLSMQPGGYNTSLVGALAILGACLCWRLITMSRARSPAAIQCKLRPSKVL